MAANATDPTASPFFRLARELRDQIYDECLVDRSSKKSASPRYFVKNMAATNLQLVSRQFSSEYGQRARQLAHCTIVSDPGRQSTKFGHSIPTAITKIGFVQLDLASHFLLRDKISAIGSRVSEFVEKMTNLQSLTIRAAFPIGSCLECPSCPGVKNAVQALNHELWLALRHLKQLEVYVGIGDGNLAEIGPQHMLVAKLVKRTGKVEAVKN